MLKDDIAPYFAKTEQISEIFEAEQPELDILEEDIESWMQELHIMTAVKTIDEWEDDFHLDHNQDLTIEQRRARVFAKKMQRMIPDREGMEAVIKSLLGATRVSITEQDCSFSVTVESVTLLDNLKIAEDYFRKIRVAHFGFEFTNQLIRTYEMVKYFTPVVEEYKEVWMEVQR